MSIIFILGLMIIKTDLSITCPKNDTVSVANSFNKIGNQIITFNLDNQDYFISIIINKVKTSFTLSDLSGLDIVAEPNFLIDRKLLCPVDKDSMYSGLHRLTDYSSGQLFISKSKDSSIYSYFEKPLLDQNNIMAIFRLYDKSGKQTDLLEIYEHPNVMYLNAKLEWESSRPLIMRVNLSDSTDPFLLGWERGYGAPKNIKMFNINIGSAHLYRCVLYNNTIYSLECLKRIYPKDKLEEILIKPENELCGCDIDNYLKYVKE